MEGAGFYLYPRKRKTRRPVYYVRFRLSRGKWSSYKNSGKTNRDAAELWAEEQIATGKILVPDGPVPTLDGWSADFFGVGGRYDAAKKARGRALSPTYLENLGRQYRKYLSPAFGARRINEISALELETFFLDLYNRDDEAVSGSTVNGVLRAARALFSEAERLEVIRRNPAIRVGRFAERGNERGALTRDELDRLFAMDALTRAWNGQRIPFLIALTVAGCGLRHGEAVALRPCDMKDGIVRVKRAWDKAAGCFRAPKWNSTRELPVPTRIKDEIDAYVTEEGLREDDLLFPSTDPQRPIEAHLVIRSLRRALVRIGIPEREQRRDRRFLDLHSLRHTYVTRLRCEGVPDWQIQRAAGHRSIGMTNTYTHAAGADLGQLARARIIPFSK